jgi:hypothetical protein
MGSLAFILFFSFISCEKNPTDKNKEEAPELPPVESMKIETSFFGNLHHQSLAKTAISKNNFFAASGRVLIINTVVLVASIVPTTLFVAAISQPVELGNDGKFHWIYTVHQGGNTYSADLAGFIDVPNTEVVWEMYVTSTSHNPPLDHFLWYEGRAKIGNKEGWWMFHSDLSPDTLIDVLKINWQIPDTNHRQLAFSIVEENHADFGDSLIYQIDDKNGYLKFYDSQTVQQSTIHWNAADGSGYIQWFDYKNGIKSCWDIHQDDIDCP